jgi:hypothetical protein
MAIAHEVENALQNRAPLRGEVKGKRGKMANGNTARCHSITES